MTLMFRLQNYCLLAMLIFLVPLHTALAMDTAKTGSYQIHDLTWQQEDGMWVCRIKGNAAPAYTTYELFSPHRIIIDIANGTFPGAIKFPLKYTKGPINSIKGEVLNAQNPPVARLELLLAEDNAYLVKGSGHDILVQFNDSAQKAKQSDKAKRQIKDITITDSGNMSEIHVLADGPIQKYESSEEQKEGGHPPRLIVDLPGMSTPGHTVSTGNDFPVSLIRDENYKNGVRLILESAGDNLFHYSIAAQSEGLLISMEENPDQTAAIAKMTGASTAQIAQSNKGSSSAKRPENAAATETAERMPSATVKKSTQSSDKNCKTDFAGAGYTSQKISVDFYKIDLHNVFRLIGEISGKNIVVDEKVNGSLTLTMNDVPWDFVLDVILNLKGLAKEERYNTIVISEKKDQFTWPEHTAQTLAIEPKAEAISVTKKMEVSTEKLEGTKYIREGKNLEDAGNYAGALTLYEKAFRVLPENGELAKRITYVALVKLGLNAKAAHYGQIAAGLLPQDADVALQTALSLANMEKIHEAKSYFDFAVSGKRPSRQALASYAAFSEQNNSNEMAMSLLKKYEQMYGESLETMVSKARIYDKLGEAEQASQEYQAILLSGFKVPPDLEQYIKERLHR